MGHAGCSVLLPPSGNNLKIYFFIVHLYLRAHKLRAYERSLDNDAPCRVFAFYMALYVYPFCELSAYELNTLYDRSRKDKFY